MVECMVKILVYDETMNFIGGWGCEANREIIDECVRVGARDDVVPVAGSRGGNMSYCCSFARFPSCFTE